MAYRPVHRDEVRSQGRQDEDHSQAHQDEDRSQDHQDEDRSQDHRDHQDEDRSQGRQAHQDEGHSYFPGSPDLEDDRHKAGADLRGLWAHRDAVRSTDLGEGGLGEDGCPTG